MTQLKEANVSTLEKTKISPNIADEIPLQILLVEDSEIVRQVVELMLRKVGYKIDLAQNGLEAIQTLKNKKYDLVLMDVQMPEMDGLVATTEICRLWPSDRPRIVGMSAGTTMEDKDLCLQVGMDDYISKPLSWKELQKILYQSMPSKNKFLDKEIKPTITSFNDDFMNWRVFEQIKSLHVGDVSGWNDLIEIFHNGWKEKINLIKEACQTNQIKKTRSLAHTLKGNASNLGAIKIADLFYKMEKMSDEEIKNNYLMLIQQLETEFFKVYDLLKATKI